ncbi:hypothetical protein [Hymenobacter nivis]|uniref:Uncharacterized protein n=1 Tax=Hymenobacter nivis TaxID=1850093 RepID=A0A2Z3GSR4_9BACT|nr:hypothetical protein [Hymenobacter nivis]AWM34105.1 hypothetical protein DDQ68_15720 [Hymenobacter nivis]
MLLSLVFALLLLNPGLLYANRTATAHYVIYHNRPLDPALLPRVEQARALVQRSNWFDPALRLNICLNDGSRYPGLVEKLQGPAFAWGFYRNVVLSGAANPMPNYLLLNGYRWNLVQLLAHEATHCYQVRRLGFWHSNPVAHYPPWKWEGYAEYVARRGPNYPPLRQQIQQLTQAEQATPHEWGITLADSTSTSREYVNYLILTTYCLDVKKMTYQQLLADTTSEQTIQRQMASWYQQEESSALVN